MEAIDPDGSANDDEGRAAAKAAAAEDREGAAAEAEPETTKSPPDTCTEFLREGATLVHTTINRRGPREQL